MVVHIRRTAGSGLTTTRRAVERRAEVPARKHSSRRAVTAHRTPERTPYDVDHLVDVLVGLAAFRRRPHAALDVVLEHEDGQGVHRRAQGRGLLEDVDAVLLALDHPGDTPRTWPSIRDRRRTSWALSFE